MAGMAADTRPLRHALVVEDSASLRALITGAVTSLGFVVEAVADAKAAMRIFPSLDPDVLIADVDLGSRPNGVELAHILKTLEHTGGNKSRAAQILGIERSTLDRRLKRLNE